MIMVKIQRLYILWVLEEKNYSIILGREQMHVELGNICGVIKYLLAENIRRQKERKKTYYNSNRRRELSLEMLYLVAHLSIISGDLVKGTLQLTDKENEVVEM